MLGPDEFLILQLSLDGQLNPTISEPSYYSWPDNNQYRPIPNSLAIEELIYNYTMSVIIMDLW